MIIRTCISCHERTKADKKGEAIFGFCANTECSRYGLYTRVWDQQEVADEEVTSAQSK